MANHTARVALGLMAMLAAAGCHGDDPSASNRNASAGASSVHGNSAAGADASGAGAGSSIGPDTTGVEGALSAQYPRDEGLEDDPAVLFHDDFENGWGAWDAPVADTEHLHMEGDSALAHAGAGFLRSTVTVEQLQADEYISSSTRLDFPERVDSVYWRFYARFVGVSITPHHWVRLAAGDEGFSASGLANTVPSGDQGFWFDFDANTDDVFNFYAYWYKMRSGRCNDGTATPGCEGDQGTTYHYGNVFRPPSQAPFPRDEWFCIEIMAQTNTVGTSNGSLAFWIDDELIGHYSPGTPTGTWLRDSFHTGGCDYSACTEPLPFEGFDFRSSDAVRFKGLFLDAYYERNSTANKQTTLRERGLDVLDEQTIYYDDVVVATQRIGCMVRP